MSNDNAPHDPDHQPAVGGPVERMVRPPHGSAEEFATSEDPHCKDGGKACIDCLLRGACLMAADDTRCDDDASWNASDENRA